MKKSFLVLTLLVNLMSFEILPVETKFQTGFPLFSWLLVKLSYKTDVPGEYYAAGAVVAVISKIVYDVSWHDAYKVNAEKMYKDLVNYINANNIKSLHDSSFTSFFSSYDLDSCLQYEMWLQNSYNNWLTPWNWTSTQAVAYEKMKIISMIMLHLPLVNLSSQEIEQVIDNHARKYCSAVSEYPLIYYGNVIDSHLNILSQGLTTKTYNGTINTMLIELDQSLRKIKYVLRRSAAYINECHAKKTHDLLNEVARSY